MRDIQIEFRIDSAGTVEWSRLVDIIRNFGEELSLALSREDLADLPMREADAAIDLLLIRVKSRRKVGRVMSVIKKMLIRYHLCDRVTIETLVRAPD